MAIEDVIRQTKFESEYQKAAVNLLHTSSWLYNGQSIRLKPYNITPEQFNVLRILRGSHPKPLRLADIACRMIDKSSNATRLVEKLRQKGLVSRTTCESNRRQVDIKITPKGLAMLNRIDKETEGWMAMMKNMTKSEAAELNRILDKLRG